MADNSASDSDSVHPVLIREFKGRFTRYDFVARDKFTSGLRRDLRTIYTGTTFSLAKLNMQTFAPGFTERKF